jgi:hypothetical protein
MDKKIKKIMKTEKKAVKETKSLLKEDHKQDAKIDKCNKMMMHKKTQSGKK